MPRPQPKRSSTSIGGKGWRTHPLLHRGREEEAKPSASGPGTLTRRERTYTDEELANIDPPPVEFEGKKYTAYEATQMQRRIERSIRKQKRLKTAYESAGLTGDAAAGAKLRTLNRKYKAFSKAAGLPEQRERMRVSYVDDASIKQAARLKEIADFKSTMESSGYSLKGFDNYSGDMESLRQAQNAFTRLSNDFPNEVEGLTVGIRKAEDGTIGWFDNKSKTIYFSKTI